MFRLYFVVAFVQRCKHYLSYVYVIKKRKRLLLCSFSPLLFLTCPVPRRSLCRGIKSHVVTLKCLPDVHCKPRHTRNECSEQRVHRVMLQAFAHHARVSSADSAEVGRYLERNQAINIKGGKQNGLNFKNLKNGNHKIQLRFLHDL